MKIKIAGALVAVLTACAGFALSPLAYAEDIFAGPDNTDPEAEGPTILEAFAEDGSVYLQWEASVGLYKYEYDGGYNLFRSSGGGDLEKIASIEKGLEAYTDYPRNGTYTYLVTYYLIAGEDTYHSKDGESVDITVAFEAGEEVAEEASDEVATTESTTEQSVTEEAALGEVPAEYPNGPSIVETYIDDGSVYLQWGPSAGLYESDHDGGYNLSRSSDGGAFEYVASIGKGLEAYVDAPGNGSHEYRLTYYLRTEEDSYHSNSGETTTVTVKGPIVEEPVSKKLDTKLPLIKRPTVNKPIARAIVAEELSVLELAAEEFRAKKRADSGEAFAKKFAKLSEAYDAEMDRDTGVETP